MKIATEKRNKKGDIEEGMIFSGTIKEFEYLEKKGYIKGNKK